MRAGERIATRTGTRAIGRGAVPTLPLGDLIVDRPGSDVLGFEVPITGTLPYTATAELYYTPSGGSETRGPDLMRVRADLGTDVGRTDAFAGALWDLTEGTSYGIRIVVRDGAVSQSLTTVVSTRALAADTSATPPTQIFTSATNLGVINAALAVASPGDIFEFQGTVPVSGIVVPDGVNGTASQPIYIRGDDRNTARVGDLSAATVFDVRASHWVIEDLTILGNRTSKYVGCVRVDGRDSTAGRSPIAGFTLRRCFLRGKFGMRLWEGSVTNIRDADIYQNVVEGIWDWQTIVAKKDAGTIDDTWDDSGIQITGQGHSVFNNTLSGYGDTIKVHRETAINNTTQAYIRNRVLWSGDDAFELDDAYRNCIAYQNYATNTGTGGSKQPNPGYKSGGPAYFVRNVFANQFLRPFKLNDSPAGVMIVHNTLVETQNAATDPALNSTWIQYGPANPDNTHVWNNLWANTGPSRDRHIWFDEVYLDQGTWDGSAYFPDLSFSFQPNDQPLASNTSTANFAAAQGHADYPEGYGAGNGFENSGKVLAAQPFDGGVLQYGANWRTYVGGFDPRLSAATPAASGAISIPGYDSTSHGAINQGDVLPSYGATTLSSPLRVAAESLASGQTIKLTTNGLIAAATWPGEATSFIQWMGTACWCPIRRKIVAIGKRESNSYHYHRLEYDEATNTWSQSDNLHPNALVNQSGHGYDLTALDPDTGDIYHRRYNTSAVEKWTRETDSWSSITPIPGTVDIAEALEWWPGRGLVYSDVYGVRLWNGSSWATIVPSASVTSIGYHSFGEVQPNADVYIFGGGNAGATRLYRVDSSNTLTLLGAAPVGLGNASTGQGTLVGDPSTHYMIAWGPAADSWSRLDPLADSWVGIGEAGGDGSTPAYGAPQIDYSINGCLAVPISTYGVIMFLREDSDDVWLYRA